MYATKLKRAALRGDKLATMLALLVVLGQLVTPAAALKFQMAAGALECVTKDVIEGGRKVSSKGLVRCSVPGWFPHRFTLGHTLLPCLCSWSLVSAECLSVAGNNSNLGFHKPRQHCQPVTSMQRAIPWPFHSIASLGLGQKR